MSSVYAAPMACRAASPLSPSDACAKSRVWSIRQRSAAARKMACLFGNSRKRYGCETPTRRAIVSVEVPWYPLRANSVTAARITLSRRSSALIRTMRLSY